MQRVEQDDRLATWRESVALVRGRIDEAARASGRSGDDVRILAAVKYVDADACRVLAAAGVHHFAENRGDELVRKQDALARDALDPAPTWHYIGRVQSRQVVDLARRVDMVHALASTRAAGRLAAAARDGLALPQLLVQVNVARDPAKDGLLPEDVDAWLDGLDDEVRIAGLMTMPEFTQEPEHSRSAFAALRELRDTLAERWTGRHPMHHLSMGTSQDHLVAVAEGATHVRLGRILYAGTE